MPTATIKDIMCTSPSWLPQTATIQEAAAKMAELDCGFIPVGEKEKLVGIVTDRDIALRATAKGLPPTTKVSEIMTSKVLYCYETDTTSDVVKNMGDNQVRRLVVLSNSSDKKLTGIVSVCDVVTSNKTEATTCHNLMKSVSTSTTGSKSGKSKAA
jgi:signal-transduction protein with cAMP-binding, CBS, and nucleotidyltransferase domain